MTDNATPLFVAAQNGYLEVVSYLLSLDAEVNIRRTDGVTPLWMACQMGHYDIVEELIAHGAHPSIPREDGTTPLFKAQQKGFIDIVEMLLSHGRSTGLLQNGDLLQHAATRHAHQDVKDVLNQI
ncbi:uncharacterized protein LOC143234838 isoform X1 [Tachypleus tridentatus]|uniref:uncharacterized protein LOC143234838 isoform X1 n=1 Tax=Tachypleus tridentatus TaxID=6853 RepID=UPI003FD29BBC